MVIDDQTFNETRRKYGLMSRRLCSTFGGGILDEETLQQCSDRAIWRCLQSHDDKRQDIKSSLYRFARWECQRAMSEKHKSKIPTVEVVESGYDDDRALNRMMLEDYLAILNERDRRMVEKRFLQGKTFREIGKEEGLSTQGAIDIINRSVGSMSRMAAA